MMHGREKSDSGIVAGKPTNKAVSTAAEPVERRAEAKGNASQQSTRRTQSRVSVSQALERIRQAVTKNALPSHTQGGSRMPELGPYGSVRGALSNERPLYVADVAELYRMADRAGMYSAARRTALPILEMRVARSMHVPD